MFDYCVLPFILVKSHHLKVFRNKHECCQSVVCVIQEEDNSRGQQGVKDLVQSVNDRYRGYANTEEEKEK